MPLVYRDFAQPQNPKSTKVAFLGAANAGKSTLLNFLVNDQVSIVSPRPQTTRKRTQGIMTIDDTQVIFLDSPGVTTPAIDYTSHQTQHSRQKLRFNRELLNSPWRCLDEADHLVVLVDIAKAAAKTTHAEDYIFKRLSESNYSIPATLVMNKVDSVDRTSPIFQLISEKYLSQYKFFDPEPTYISAITGEGVDFLKHRLLRTAVPRQWSFPAKITSDMSDYDRAVEAIRAAYFSRLRSYLPYVFQQVNRGWIEPNDGSLHIHQDILVTKAQHEKILVGAQGSLITEVIQEATIALRRQLARKVKVYLQVKVVDKFPANINK